MGYPASVRQNGKRSRSSETALRGVLRDRLSARGEELRCLYRISGVIFSILGLHGPRRVDGEQDRAGRRTNARDCFRLGV